MTDARFRNEPPLCPDELPDLDLDHEPSGLRIDEAGRAALEAFLRAWSPPISGSEVRHG